MDATTTAQEDARKIRLLEWLIMPPSERQPVSQRQLAEELGVSPRTLRDWQAQPEFRAKWEKAAKDVIGSPEKVQRVLERMASLALDENISPQHSVQAARVYLDAVDGIKPPAVDMAAKKAAEMSTDELRALVAEAAQHELVNREAL